MTRGVRAAREEEAACCAAARRGASQRRASTASYSWGRADADAACVSTYSQSIRGDVLVLDMKQKTQEWVQDAASGSRVCVRSRDLEQRFSKVGLSRGPRSVCRPTPGLAARASRSSLWMALSRLRREVSLFPTHDSFENKGADSPFFFSSKQSFARLCGAPARGRARGGGALEVGER